MKSKVMQVTGLALAMAGALSIANAQDLGGEGGKRPKPLSAAEIIKKFDKDGNGQLSENEVQAFVEEMKSRRPEKGQGGRGGGFNREEMIEKYDTDGDGRLNAEERKAMMEELRAKRSQQSE